MKSSVVMYGPSGCGKTRDSQKIADALGLTTIVDGWDVSANNFFPLRHLFITNFVPDAEIDTIKLQYPGVIVVSYFDDTIQNLLR